MRARAVAGSSGTAHPDTKESPMSATMIEQLVGAFEAEGQTGKDVLDCLTRLSGRITEHVKTRTTVTSPAEHSRLVKLSNDVELFAGRASAGEWEGSFQLMSDELVRTALETGEGSIVEVVWLDDNDDRRHTKGLLIEADSNLIFADEATIDREYVLAFGLSA